MWFVDERFFKIKKDIRKSVSWKSTVFSSPTFSNEILHFFPSKNLRFIVRGWGSPQHQLKIQNIRLEGSSFFLKILCFWLGGPSRFFLDVRGSFIISLEDFDLCSESTPTVLFKKIPKCSLKYIFLNEGPPTCFLNPDFYSEDSSKYSLKPKDFGRKII